SPDLPGKQSLILFHSSSVSIKTTMSFLSQIIHNHECRQNLVDEIKNNLKQDPGSKIGIYLGKKIMDWVNGVYGKKYAHLRTKKFEQGFGEGKGLDEVGLTPEIVSWMDKAMDAYWRDRIYGILDQVGKVPSPSVLALWNEMLVDMYGEETSRKNAIYEIALNDDQVSPEAKAWLRNLLDS
ncbi:hypothetical protein SCJ10_05925, partial [Legionella pneumophila serogroup 1]